MASPLQRELNKSGMWQRRLEPKVAGQALSTGKMKAQQTEAAKEAAVDPPWKKCVFGGRGKQMGPPPVCVSTSKWVIPGERVISMD